MEVLGRTAIPGMSAVLVLEAEALLDALKPSAPADRIVRW
jgi:hypothetical protein